MSVSGVTLWRHFYSYTSPNICFTFYIKESRFLSNWCIKNTKRETDIICRKSSLLIALRNSSLESCGERRWYRHGPVRLEIITHFYLCGYKAIISTSPGNFLLTRNKQSSNFSSPPYKTTFAGQVEG